MDECGDAHRAHNYNSTGNPMKTGVEFVNAFENAGVRSLLSWVKTKMIETYPQHLVL
jgi:hypothetical protein